MVVALESRQERTVLFLIIQQVRFNYVFYCEE
jgi:hypothetical protein